jgi:hypothetical protein
MYNFIAAIPLIYFAYLIYLGATKGEVNGMRKLCLNCFSVGKPRLITKGDIGTEIVLWLCFILPGIVYSVWRHTSRYYGCPVCGECGMIPISSPRAKHFNATGIITYDN